MIRPDRARFDELAASGRLVPVWREVVADADTPVSAYAKLGGREGSFLLESVVGGERWADYSFVGVEPTETLTVAAGEDAAPALERLLARHAVADGAAEGLPRFFGGAVGYLAYDAVRAWEPVPSRAADETRLPDAVFVVPSVVVVFDNLRQTVKIVACARAGGYDGACQKIGRIANTLAAPSPPLRPLDLDAPPAAPPPSRTPRAAFLDAVARIHQHILAGDAFQVVLSQRFEAPRDGVDPFDLYRALRVTNPSPCMFHLALPGGLYVTGASPETLVRLEGARVTVKPIAGTRPRGRTPEEDARLADELRADEKENAEHVMLIDLGRNDVGRVARVGTVRVETARAIERYSHVMHLVSLVSGELADGKSALDVVRAAFPAGTLTGAPKVRAMQIIDALEPVRRGVYGGAVGYFAFPDGRGRGNLDLAIAIRTLVTVGERVLVQAGAGVVHDSVPEKEYDETVAKARACLRALEIARSRR